jgi:serine protease Do
MIPLSESLNREMTAIANSLRQSTVQIRGHRGGVGSGIIWNSAGLIITNAHVVRSRQAIVELADGRTLNARVVAIAPHRDLAALAVKAPNLTAATIGDSTQLRVGDLVFAVGNPLGTVGALTTGIIHTVAPPGSPIQRSWIQADVRLAPGNSGGPLANAQGQVIGVNSMIADGLAIAIPSQMVERFLGSQDSQPYLGVTLQPVVLPLNRQRVFGWLILELAANSPAAASGLLVGDVVIGIAGKLFQFPGDLAATLNVVNPGDRLLLNLVRGGNPIEINVTLGSKGSGVQAA